MKKLITLSLALLSSSAFAVEVGTKVAIPKDAITCTDIQKPRLPRCPYCYILDDMTSGKVEVKANIAGVTLFSGTTTSCADFINNLEIGPSALAEVVSVQDRKLDEKTIYRIIQISLGGAELVGSQNL